MTDLVEFLEFYRARLNEDEQVASAASPGRWTVGSAADDIGAADVVSDDGNVTSGRENPCCSTEDAVHIALHDPDRVLREVEAKREFLDFAVRTRDLAEQQPTEGQARELRVKWAAYLTALKFDAVRYADHSDYREGWRP